MTMLDPIARFSETFARASTLETFDATRAALATSDRAGRPSLRFVLVKRWDARGFCFFTNLGSRKASELRANPHAALAFHWATIGEQIRIEGSIEAVSESEADDYFSSRPRGSQLGAWASEQSQTIAARSVLTERLAEIEARFRGRSVERPDFWGGFRLLPRELEFWRDRPDRLHDRELYTRSGDGWHIVLLAP
jgi:pyridoxamine 5'-phosphate oxidase